MFMNYQVVIELEVSENRQYILIKYSLLGYSLCIIHDCSILMHRVSSNQRLILLPNYKGLGNRLQLFSGLYFLSIRHRIPIISTFKTVVET